MSLKKDDVPSGWSLEAADFINKVIIVILTKLIQRKVTNRLGLTGIKELKTHVWFQNYPWKDLYNKKIESPFSPKVYYMNYK